MARARSIAVAQTCPVAGDVQTNLDEHVRFACLAATEGAGVVVFPELSLSLRSAGRSSIWFETGELLVQLGVNGSGVAVVMETQQGRRTRAVMLSRC